MGPAAMHRFAPDGISFMTQVRLQDGTWATFDTQITPESANLPWRLLLTLAILLAVVLVVSYVAVRWVTRPLHVLASAADELGRDINRPPLPESGPVEVSRAAHAFNNMQARLIHFIEERTRILAAMSHDLKTPITRMRLRAEMLEDENLREKFEKDLLEMQAMVTQALDFMRGLSNGEPEQLVDVMALLETPAGRQRSHGAKGQHRGACDKAFARGAATSQAVHRQSHRQRGALREASRDPGRRNCHRIDTANPRPWAGNAEHRVGNACSNRSIGSRGPATGRPAEPGSA